MIEDATARDVYQISGRFASREHLRIDHAARFLGQRQGDYNKVAIFHHRFESLRRIQTMDKIPLRVTDPFGSIATIAGMHSILFGGEHSGAELPQQAGNLPADATVADDPDRAGAQLARFEPFPAVPGPLGFFLVCG